MRVLSSCALLLVPLAFGPSRAPQALRFAVADGSVVHKTYEHAFGLELESISMRFNDEDIDPAQFGLGQIHVESSEHIAFTDTYGATADGRPRRVERAFDRLEGLETQSVESEDGEESEKRDESSELEGLSVAFVWNAEDGVYDREFVGGDGDSDLLEGLVEDTDLRRFLPEGEVDVAATWSVDAQAFNAFFYPGGDVALVSEKDSEDADDSQKQLRENLTGDLRATFAGLRKVDDLEVAVIELQGDLATFAETEKDLDGAGSTHSRYEVAHAVKGEILWLPAAGRAHSVELESKVKFSTHSKTSIDMGGESHSSERTMLFTGLSTFTTSFVAQE